MENQPHREPATPEEIWNILRAVSEKQEKASREMEEQRKKADRETEDLKKQIKETDRQIQETAQQMKETAQQQKETDRQLKKTDAHFNSQWGKLMESLVEGDLVPLLRAQGILVEETSTNVKGGQEGRHYEFDILAVNGEEVVVVEVKTTLRPEDVTHFLSKLERFTGWVRRYKGNRILGAVAYLKADSNVVLQAERQGLYVIRATGSSASIVNQSDFQPRTFY